MERDNDLDLQRQTGGTVYSYDDEDKFYRDVTYQIKEGKPRIYIYNKKIVDRIQEEYPDLTIKKTDFYWEVFNYETKYHIG